ncbi:hypothetical protein ACS0TY_005620 [Phlomoides rotata]
MAESDPEDEGVIRVDLGSVEGDLTSTLCLIGKVITSKPFNAFDFLEAMKRAMAPPKGFVAREIDKNLFLFHFNSEHDMRVMLNRELCLFEKKVVTLKELERGEQPATMNLNRASFWVRLYELPMVARNHKIVELIVGKIGELLEVGSSTLGGFGMSVRVKVKVDLQKPIKCGIHLELNKEHKL